MKSKNYTIFLILFYLWVLIVNPQSRFPILGEIHFERILVLISWIVLIFTNRFNLRLSTMTFLIIIFYVLMNISYFISPYQHYPLAKYWLENYWKYLGLYFLVLFSIEDIMDIFYIFTGFVVILFLYQIHSWYDFLNGGSYVWQAGIKRIVGIWSEGIGAANYFGVITLYSLPFALFWYKSAEKRNMKILMILYLVLSFITIVYTGTRGALLGVVFFILINIRNLKHLKVASFVLIAFLVVAAFSFPEYLKYRYFSFIAPPENYTISARFAKQQEKSALGRLTGLVDGWKLVKKRPVLGYGPNSSPASRKLVNPELRQNEEYDYQMHNLYGQILAETGFAGTFIFFLIIFLYFYQFRDLRDIATENPEVQNYILALQNSMLLMLFYGIASHTLYRYNWLLLFACQSAFIDIVTKKFRGKRALVT